ncbi:MAG: alpha/beta hydrolase [candidate division Zixibacteria bacterium]|nr:alpha/beta hydrolase [candidate division Zixibacteria bacterium]
MNTRKIPPYEIILFGRSLGAAVASKIATEISPRALILESPISSIPDLGAQIYPFLPVRLLARFEYNTAKHVGNVSCPTLVIHSRDDEIAPFSGGRKVFEATANPAGFLEISGGHNDGFLVSGEKYRKGLDKFITDVLK